jgi:hypothetical protein
MVDTILLLGAHLLSWLYSLYRRTFSADLVVAINGHRITDKLLYHFHRLFIRFRVYG